MVFDLITERCFEFSGLGKPNIVESWIWPRRVLNGITGGLVCLDSIMFR